MDDEVHRARETLSEYKHIRAEPTRFVVKKNHVVKEIEHVVETVPDHMVVEKHGEAGKVAIKLQAATESR